MKFVPFLLLGGLASASALDETSFGHRLNGWHRDGSARYSLAGARYRTIKPVEHPAAGGGRIVKVTVIHQPNPWVEVPFDLEVSFAADGSAQSARISGLPRGHKVDTGFIARPEVPEGDREARPLAEMVKMLFESLDPLLARAAEAEDLRKRDLLARVRGPEPVEPAAIAAGLRYNLDLLLGMPPAASE